MPIRHVQLSTGRFRGRMEAAKNGCGIKMEAAKNGCGIKMEAA
jgi:hypothetical protein